MRTRQATIFEKVAQQDDEITRQSKELAEVRHELSDLHDILKIHINKRDERHAADQAVIEALRENMQEMMDVNKRLDYMVEFVNKQKRKHDRHTHDK